ncbi:MAG: glycoside hydrolase family 3 protein [Clostridia bacterium]|nr:glycoside hydrolase family 3 protein [Clostridia bacterium]
MKKVSSWKELTLREKIGQTVVCTCKPDEHIKMCGSVEELLKKYPIGGIFNNGANINGLDTGENEGFKNLVKEYNSHLRVPMFTVADNGTYASKNGVNISRQMAVGAANDEETAYRMGEFQAEDCKKTGINWLLWPVCDINFSKRSPITDIRSVGSDPELVTRMVRKELEAMKDNNVISCLKHYPGTPYDEHLDPHLTSVDNKTPLDFWMANYGKMYKELFKENAPTIMTGHMNLVNYQNDEFEGKYPPATMSYDLTTKLLREELGFKGVVITDALCMGGFTGENALQNTIKSFLAGNDVLLWPSFEYIDEMERLILSGEVKEEVLDAAVERIWNLKAEYGILEQVDNSSDKTTEFFEGIANELAEKSLTLINNERNLIPLDQNKIKKVLIIGVTPSDKQFEELGELKSEFEANGCQVEMRRNNISPFDNTKDSKENDLVLFALCRTPHMPLGPLDFWGNESASIWASNTIDKNKTVVASFGSPYVYKYYENSNLTYINAYHNSKEVIKAFVAAIFGKKPFTGISSVELI